MNTSAPVFPDVIGQQHIQQQLVSLVENNRLSHALLFVGSEGSGVLPLAVGFAQYVVSQQAMAKPQPVMVADLFGGMSSLPAEPDDTAGENNFLGIDSKALELIHPDLHFSYPVVKKNPDAGAPSLSGDWAAEWRLFYRQNCYGNLYDWLQFIKAENRQGNISARECDDIMHKLSLKPFESRYKVLVMWMPEMLGNEGNKLLKLIEEPPPDTLFILAAEHEERLLSTIVSRCQLVRIPPIKPDDLAAALAQRHNLGMEKALQIALISNGSYREAVQLLEHHEENWNNLLRDWLNAALLKAKAGTNPFGEQNRIIGELAALGREKQKQLLLYFLELIEQSLRLRLVGEANLMLPPQEAEFAARINKMAGPSTLAAMAEILEPAIYHIERNANGKMLFHSLTIRLRYLLEGRTRIGLHT
ncbi:MAG: hypothetical protein MUF24_05880 [Chitinophagaceae bacterium]|nr:hypothetical protein [Chitinophagaceae bacterium]